MGLPITDLIVAAVSKMVDDSQADTYREPTHSDLNFYIGRAGLSSADPNVQGQTVGKAKRVRAVLSWALDNDQPAGGKLIEGLMSKIRASGGFRETSANYIGKDVILRAVDAFSSEGYVLALDGDLRPNNLGSLSGRNLTEALHAYARRAKKGCGGCGAAFRHEQRLAGSYRSPCHNGKVRYVSAARKLSCAAWPSIHCSWFSHPRRSTIIYGRAMPPDGAWYVSSRGRRESTSEQRRNGPRPPLVRRYYESRSRRSRRAGWRNCWIHAGQAKRRLTIGPAPTNCSAAFQSRSVTPDVTCVKEYGTI